MEKYYDIIIIVLLTILLILISKNNISENWTDECSGSSESSCDTTKCIWSNGTCYNGDTCPAYYTPCTDSSQICRQPTMSMQCSEAYGYWWPGPPCPCKPGDTPVASWNGPGSCDQYLTGPPDGGTDTYIQYGCAQSSCCKES